MHNDKFSKEFIKKWSHLLSEVDMHDVPIEYINRLELFFNDGRKPAYIDIPLLLEQDRPWKIERMIEKELESIDDVLERVDFHLNFEKVVNTVDDATNTILKKL